MPDKDDDKRIPRGYPRTGLSLGDLRKPSLTTGFGLLLADWGLIFSAAALSAAAAEMFPVEVGSMLYLIAALVIARQQRALECMTHEGSHHNFSRSQKGLNDLLCNLMASYAVFSEVSAFRDSHEQHHRNFGGPTDPDLARHRELDAAGIDRESFFGFVRSVVERLPAYWWGWWRAIGTDCIEILICAILWHLVVLVIPLIAIFGVMGPVYWLMYWFMPMVFVLPVIRLIGEMAEHDYPDDNDDDPTASEMSVTWSNLGWLHRWLIHPRGDGFHVEHHHQPSIPGWRLAAYRELVLAKAPELAAALRIRTRRWVLLIRPFLNPSPQT